MSSWDRYANLSEVRGRTKRDAAALREIRMISNKIKDNLSYCFVLIDGKDQEVAIVNTETFTEKYIYSLPCEDIPLGSLILWMGSYWLVTERDANTTIYTKAKMTQCNHLLKWMSKTGDICEQWCVVEDATIYSNGEKESSGFVLTRGDTRIAVILPKNEQTILIDRTYRFLISDPDVKEKLAYILTKPVKVGDTYGKRGIFIYVLKETQSTDVDNHELGIADYYKYFPREDAGDGASTSDSPEESISTTNNKGWL